MSEKKSADELRDKIIGLTYQCPRGEYTPDCAFGILKGLSHESRRSTLEPLSYAELVRLFDLVSSCRCPVDPRLKTGD